MTRQCHGITQNGTRCKNLARNNKAKYCLCHAQTNKKKQARANVNVAYPKARGVKPPRQTFRGEQQKKFDLINKLVKRGDTRPRLPPDVLRRVKHNLEVIPAYFFTQKLKNSQFKIDVFDYNGRKVSLEKRKKGSRISPTLSRSPHVNTSIKTFRIKFPRALKHLFPSVSWQNLNYSFKQKTTEKVGELEMDYNALVEKLEWMGVAKHTGFTNWSGNLDITIINDRIVRFQRNRLSNRKMSGIEIIQTKDKDGPVIRLFIFVCNSTQKPHNIYVHVEHQLHKSLLL